MLQGLMMNNHHHHHQQQQQQPPPIVMDESLSNLTSAFGEASASTSSANPSAGDQLSAYPHPPLHQQEQLQNYYTQQDQEHPPPNQPPPSSKRKRNLPGNPDPDAEVIALSPKSLLATNRFLCEICNKGFQRDQNLQLHRRGHNLPWKLKQRPKDEVVRKKVYVCPETSCVHNDPSRALGDLTGIKKHFCRKHGEKKWKCDKCSKRYAVQSDWKAHSKICGTREYRCDCGTLFSRRDSFITHRAFCDALAEESARSITTNPLTILPPQHQHQTSSAPVSLSHQHLFNLQNPLITTHDLPPPPPFSIKQEHHHHDHQSHNTFNLIPPWLHHQQHQHQQQSQPQPSSSSMMFSQELLQTLGGHTQNPNTTFPTPHPHMSATALLQKAAQLGPTMSTCPPPPPPPPPAMSSSQLLHDLMMNSLSSFDGGNGGNEDLTRDFLGLGPLSHSEMLSFAGIGDVGGAGEGSVAGNGSPSSASQDRHDRSSWQG